MELDQAIAIVLTAQLGYDAPNNDEARDTIAHVRNTISLNDPAPLGAVTLDDDGSLEALAYHAVLSATEETITAALS